MFSKTRKKTSKMHSDEKTQNYHTYTGYKEDTPETDTLFEYAKPVLPRGMQKKRKSWKNTVRKSCIPNPRPGKVHKKHGQRKKKKQHRSQRIYCTNGKHRDKKKENLTHHSHSKEMEKDADTTQQRSDTGLARVHPLPIRTDDFLQPVRPRVHVYDHGNYLFNIDVDNYNVLYSINDEVSKKCKIPAANFMLEYNGKAVNSNWPLHVQNEANIHLIVKGKGGMKEGDDSAQSNDKKNDGTLANPIADSFERRPQSSEVVQEEDQLSLADSENSAASIKEPKEIEIASSSTESSGDLNNQNESTSKEAYMTLEHATKDNTSFSELPEDSFERRSQSSEVVQEEDQLSLADSENSAASIKEPKEIEIVSSSTESSDGLNNQNESTSKEADMPLEHTTKDNTSFSELPE
ncbi:uncharacterized protein, partial [Argopecten irradians]|uniref:uncharacterized protein n=1 Tax=Argopecten irradians TaxID=31199 RepID=UPI003713635A